jgi:ABC-type glycerol-3-phosphate transport system substrate-binding protein
MAGEGADVTNPTSNLDDFIGLEFTTGPDGKLYQLPDQQFANLYWFRYDWFTDEKNMADFEAEYGYPLGVPVNWSAYEDIAEFFTGRDSLSGRRGRGLWQHGLRQEATRRSAGATPTRGCRWPAWATLASRTACRSTSGAFV